MSKELREILLHNKPFALCNSHGMLKFCGKTERVLKEGLEEVTGVATLTKFSDSGISTTGSTLSSSEPSVVAASSATSRA